MFKAIVFDLGGVIFSSNATSYEGREKLAKILNIEPKKLQDFWFEKKEKLITGKLSEEDYLRGLILSHKLSRSLEELKKIIRDSDIINKEMINILLELKKKYVLLALTNDVNEWLSYKINKFCLRNYFEAIISSSDIGLVKPDKNIYEYTLKKINLSPKEIIFVDDREENVKSAMELGIKSFHFTNTDDFIIWLRNEKILS